MLFVTLFIWRLVSRYISHSDKMEKKTCPGCSPCSDDGNYSPAGHYCVECEMYFCGTCVKYHNKMPTLKCHQMNALDVDTSDLPMLTGDDETARPISEANETGKRVFGPSEPLKCPIHQGQCIDTFCKDHDEVCCGTCAIVKHRHCVTQDISIAAKDFQSSEAVGEVKDAFNDLITRLEKETVKRTNNLKSIETEKLDQIASVDNYEEDCIAKIKKLADNSRQKIRSKYDEHKTAIDDDVADLNAVKTSLQKQIENVDNITDLEILLFVITKTGTWRRSLRDSEQFLESVETEWKHRQVVFNIDLTVANFLDKLEYVGQLGNDCIPQKYTATFLQDISLNQSESDLIWYHSPGQVSDMCVINNGDIIVAVTGINSSLQRFNSDLSFKDQMKLPQNYPKAVCAIGQQDVAVRMEHTKDLHIVTVGETMQLTSSFKLDDDGCGVVYNARTEEIYACESDKISVYSKAGIKRRSYYGKDMFSDCRKIALAENSEDLYVTDNYKGLVVLDKNGLLKMKVNVQDVDDPLVLCLLPGHICLVGGELKSVFGTDTHQEHLGCIINKYGEKLGKLTVTRGDSMLRSSRSSHCAAYDHENSRLIVGNNQDLSIYTITKT